MHGKGPGRLTAEERALVEQNMALVRHIVYQMANSGYVKHGLEEDAVQEGMMGLMNAARFFDPKRQTAFTTLAGKCISQRVYRLVRREQAKEKMEAISLDEKMAEGNGKALDRLWAESIPAKDDTEAEALESLPEACCRILKEHGWEEHAQLLRMYVLEGKTMAEIAQMMGITKQGVGFRLRRAGEILRRIMRDEEWHG